MADDQNNFESRLLGVPMRIRLEETVADALHFTRRYERGGIAGFHVEDEVNPKHTPTPVACCLVDRSVFGALYQEPLAAQAVPVLMI
jgi:hypothetical protein